MKKKVFDLLKILVFLAILAVCILGAVNLVRRSDSAYKYDVFFEQAQKDNIDVLFMGSSHVINALDPVMLYRDYGFTSYNMGGHGSVMQETYWELIEALDYCTPKWVVVDACMLEKNYQYIDLMGENNSDQDRTTSIKQLHLNMDAWPLNKLKIAAVKDLVKDPSVQREFLFDFIAYHSRWNELTSQDYKKLFGNGEKTTHFGAEMRKEVELSPTFFPSPDSGQELSEHTVGAEYLMKIIDECQRKGIGVVVTYLPFCATMEDKLAANTTGTIANMYGVPYLNMLNMDIIDLYTDLNDTGHLNITGAAKVTDFVGKWLSENGDLADHRGDAAYSCYDECVESLGKENISFILESGNLYAVLEMLALDDVSCVVYFNQDSGSFCDESAKKLVQNITGTDKVYTVSGPYVMIKDVAAKAVYEAGDGESIDGAVTGLGTLVYQPVEKLFRFLYPKEDESINYLYNDDHALDDIQVIIYDNESGEILGHKYFRSYGNTYREY